MYEATVISSQYLKYKKLPSIAVSESEAWMGCCELNVPILSREEFIEKAFSVRKKFHPELEINLFRFLKIIVCQRYIWHQHQTEKSPSFLFIH